MQKNTLLPGDSTVVELVFNTKITKGATTKSATIQTNDMTVAKLAIDFKANIVAGLDSVSPVKYAPDQLKFPVSGGKQTVNITNTGPTPLRISLANLTDDGMKVKIENDQIMPGAEGEIAFEWAGGTLKQGIKHVATFKTTDASIPLFSIPYVVEGTEPFPPEHAPESKPATATRTTKPANQNHAHNKPDSLNPIPIQINPGSRMSGSPPDAKHVHNQPDSLNSLK